MSRAVGVDIGGSGVRLGSVSIGAPGELHHVEGGILRPDVESVQGLIDEIRNVGPVDAVGVSVAGFVGRDGAVSTSRSCPWLEGPLRSTLARSLGVHVAVVHDGEAHLIASLGRLDRGRHPVLALVAGSSLAVAMTDEDGRLRRPRRDVNWEVGELRLPTRASRSEVWWALGRRGFRELEERDGTEAARAQFGARLGGFAAELAGVFTPRVVVLSGGLVAGNGPGLFDAARSEFATRVPWWVEAELVASPYGHAAGVVGAAVAGVSTGAR